MPAPLITLSWSTAISYMDTFSILMAHPWKKTSNVQFSHNSSRCKHSMQSLCMTIDSSTKCYTPLIAISWASTAPIPESNKQVTKVEHPLSLCLDLIWQPLSRDTFVPSINQSDAFFVCPLSWLAILQMKSIDLVGDCVRRVSSQTSIVLPEQSGQETRNPPGSSWERSPTLSHSRTHPTLSSG